MMGQGFASAVADRMLTAFVWIIVAVIVAACAVTAGCIKLGSTYRVRIEKVEESKPLSRLPLTPKESLPADATELYLNGNPSGLWSQMCDKCKGTMTIRDPDAGNCDNPNMPCDKCKAAGVLNVWDTGKPKSEWNGGRSILPTCEPPE